MKDKSRHGSKLKTFMISAMVLGTLSGIATPVFSTLSTVHAADTVNVDTSNPVNFINSIAPSASKIAASNNMYASVMIAQALIESGSGQSGLAQAPNYNLFGIKGTGTAGTVNMNTREDGANGSYTTNAGFRKYNSYAESLEDNARVITSNSLYNKVLKSNTTSYKDATAALQGAYATSTTYANTLNATIEKYNLTQYDNGTADSSYTVLSNNANLTDDQILAKYNVKPDYLTKSETTTEDVTYKTTANDSIWGIARQYKVSIDKLQTWNPGLKDISGDTLPENLEIKVGETSKTNEVAYKNVTEHNYTDVTVVPNGNLWQIAQDNKTTEADLVKLNGFENASHLIHPGDKIHVKDTTVVKQVDLTDIEKKQADADALTKAKALYAQDLAKQNAESSATDSTAQSVLVQDADTNASTVAMNNVSYDTTNVSKARQQVIALASQEIGVPYVWGGTTTSGFDCSGLVQYVFKNAINVSLPRVTTQQEHSGTRIAVNQAKPGDLYFWGNVGSTYHVAIALGNGKFIAAPQPGENVKVGSINGFMPSFAVQVLQ